MIKLYLYIMSRLWISDHDIEITNIPFTAEVAQSLHIVDMC